MSRFLCSRAVSLPSVPGKGGPAMTTLPGIDYGTKFWFERHWNPFTDHIIVDITSLGGPTVLSLVTLLTVGLLLILHRYRTAFFVLVAVAGGALLLDGVKSLVARER